MPSKRSFYGSLVQATDSIARREIVESTIQLLRAAEIASVDDLVVVSRDKQRPTDLRSACIWALRVLLKRRFVKDLVLILKNERAPDVAWELGTAIGVLGDEDVVMALHQIVAAIGPQARREGALYALNLINDERSESLLIKLLKDKDVPAKTRALAAEGLAHQSNPSSLVVLERAVKDASRSVRISAEFALKVRSHS